MDCSNLADTGSGALLVIVLGLSLVFVTFIIYLRLGTKGRLSLRLFSILLVMFLGAVLLSQPMSSTTYAAGADSRQCTTDSPNSSNGGTGQSGGGQTTPPVAQTLWNIGFNTDSDWNDFSYYNFNPDGVETMSFAAAAGVGTVTGSRPDHATGSSQREMYVFNTAPDVRDGEARALITTENAMTGANTQAGLAVRASSLGDPIHQSAVVVWNNVIFAGTGTSLLGVWQGNQEAGGTFYHDDLGALVLGDSITSLTANGTTGTVTIAGNLDPSLVAGMTLGLRNVDASINGLVTVASIIDAHTFTFNTTKTGSWTNGILDYTINSQRWFAIRVIGDQATIKHWLPNQPEPAWNDPVYSLTSTLPTTLLNGDASPTSGKFALIVAHVGDNKTIKFSNVSFKSLD